MSLTNSKALIVAGILVVFLCVEVCFRHRRALIAWFKDLPDSIDNWKRSREFRKHWRPSFLSCSSFSKKIEQVRRDPASVAGSRRRHPASHQRVMENAREAVTQSSYFGRLRNEEASGGEDEK